MLKRTCNNLKHRRGKGIDAFHIPSLMQGHNMTPVSHAFNTMSAKL